MESEYQSLGIEKKPTPIHDRACVRGKEKSSPPSVSTEIETSGIVVALCAWYGLMSQYAVRAMRTKKQGEIEE